MHLGFNLARERLVYWLSPGKKALSVLRAKWGQPGDMHASSASSYFDLTRRGSARETVDDQTWEGLEFQEIFANLDSTVTPLGSRYLFRQMRSHESDPEELKKKYAVHTRLQSDDSTCSWTERTEKKVSGTIFDSHPSDHFFPAPFFGSWLEPLRRVALFQGASLLQVAARIR